MLPEWLVSLETFRWVVVACFGAAVGLGELVSRYRDAPVRALLSGSALFYIILNAAAAVGALALIILFDVKFGVDPEKATHVAWIQVLVAGLSAMAFFRSSLFTVRLAD